MALQIFRRSRPEPPEVKASAAAPVVAFQGAGRVAWSARDTATLTRVGLSRQSGGVPLRQDHRRGGGGGAGGGAGHRDRRFDVHPVIDLLAAPNPGQGGSALMEGFYGNLLLSGDGYLEAAGEVASGGPRELYVLRSDRMKVVPGSDGWPVAYEYSAGGGEACLRHAAGPGAGAAREELPSAGRSLRAVAAGGGGERDRRA